MVTFQLTIMKCNILSNYTRHKYAEKLCFTLLLHSIFSALAFLLVVF